jgi:protein disulfide-isomerase
MLNHFKAIALSAFLIVSLAACQAQTPKTEPSQEAVAEDSQKTTEYKPGEWITDYRQALKLSAETGNPILVNFTGSDWCIWCKRLSKEVFTEQAFIDYAKLNLILLKLDFPKTIQQPEALKMQNNELLRKFGVQGFPTIILMDKEGNEIARTGYQEGGAGLYVNHLKQLLTK